MQQQQLNPNQQQPQGSWSELYGGKGGVQSQFKVPNATLVAISGRAGADLHQLHFTFRDIKTGQTIQSQYYGGGQGGQFMYKCPPGQWIDRIILRAGGGHMVNAIEVETNMGVKSGRFGGTGGKVKEIDAKGKRIGGVNIRHGQLVDAVAFYVIE